MSEDEFWGALEYRICRELNGMKQQGLNGVWCDGIRGGVDHPECQPMRMSGTIYLGRDGQTEKAFVMAVPAASIENDTVDWESLLPAEDLTAWLSVDLRGKRVAIDLSRAEVMVL